MGRVHSPVARHRLPFRQRALLDPRALRRWVLVLIAAVTTAALVAQVVVRAEQTRARWGARQTVLVIDRPLAAGDPLTDALRVEDWPLALVPDGSFDNPDALPDGATASGPLASGTPLTDVAVLAPDDASPRPRVAVPTGLAVLPLSAGDTVEVWATVVAGGLDGGPGGGSGTRRVTGGATVVGADDETVVLTVDERDVAEVAEAAALATVTLVATG